MIGRPKQEHHGSDYYWLLVTRDKYELPLYVADSVTELSRFTGKSENAIRTAICHAKQRGTGISQYKRVPKDDLQDL